MSKLRKWMMKEERDTNSCGSGDLSSSAIKLFGKTIAVSCGADSTSASVSLSVSVSTKAGSEEVDGASTQLDGETLGSSPGSICNEAGSTDGEVEDGNENGNENSVEVSEVVAVTQSPVTETKLPSSPAAKVVCEEESNPAEGQQQPQAEIVVPQRALTVEEKKEQCSKKPDKLIPCPRCESVDTKFCYYNNYNINQPRHFCKSCQRYWTAGGTLRNVLVGAGRRKNKYGVAQSKQEGGENLSTCAVRMDPHEPAQSSYSLGTVPPMNLPRHGHGTMTMSPRNGVALSDSQASTITTTHGLASALKPLGAEISSDSVSKLRQRTQTNTTTSDMKGDCASSAETSSQNTTYVLTPRAPIEAQAVWTKSSTAPLGFFNGAWPYGYNIGWSGTGGPIPAASTSLCAPHSGSLGSAVAPAPAVWTGLWASSAGLAAGAPVPAFGWNMLQGGWTLPWRPVPAVGVQMQQQQQSQGNATSPPSSRKREGSSIPEGVDVPSSRAKLARVGSGEEIVAV